MRSIVDSTNPTLRLVAKNIPLKDIGSPFVRTLISNMKKLLAKEPYGVALASPQVGESLRLFIVSGRVFLNREKKDASTGVEKEKKEDVLPPDQIYINPKLKKLSRGKKNKHEGCLSIRKLWGEVPRREKATVEAYDEHGKKFTRGASGFLAHIFQHEMDHLEGILYIDTAVKTFEDRPHKETDNKAT